MDAATDEGGRGLLLVSVPADERGVGERLPGKIVWCEFALATPVTGTSEDLRRPATSRPSRRSP